MKQNNQLRKCSECGMINISENCPKKCDGKNNHFTPKYKKVRKWIGKRGFKPRVEIILIRKFK